MTEQRGKMKPAEERDEENIKTKERGRSVMERTRRAKVRRDNS